MDTDELREIWQGYEERMDKSIKLNVEMLRRMNVGDSRKSLNKFLMAPVVGILIGFIVQVILGGFIYAHWGQPAWVATGGLLWVFALAQVVFGIYQSSVVLHIDYDSSIVGIQRKLGAMKVYRIRYLTITRFAYALLWIPVLLIAVKMAFGVDLLEHLDNTWLVINLSIGVACIVFAVWLSQKYASGKLESPFLKKLVENKIGRAHV